MTNTILHLIDGTATPGGHRTQPVYNPATGASTKQVLLADKATVEAAIASAQAAFSPHPSNAPASWGA